MLLLLLFSLAFGQFDPNRFKVFFLENRMPQCPTTPTQPRLPKSYHVPPNYYDTIPANQRIPPGQNTQPTMVPACNKQIIQPGPLDAYQFQTERFITTMGLNIYDGSLWAMALSLLGERSMVSDYESGIISQGKTCQFANIRGDSKCVGVIVEGGCSDPDQAGICGFCYGGGNNKTMSKQNAWTFRSLSDYWSLQGTIDQRCPALKHEWTWNDYKPVLGENSWAYLIGPLQTATRKYNGWQNIPENDLSLQLAINMLPSLSATFIPSLGAVAYAPHNTLLNPTKDLGYEVSLENNISLLGGLKMLLFILQNRNIHTQHIPLVKQLVTGIESFTKQCYDPNLGYFRQGGILQKDGSFQWATGPTSFAVDCQTWTMSQIGPNTVNSWFGPNAAQSIWNKTKELGGYHYNFGTGEVDGFGFAQNVNDQAYSGEWTLGAINMLKVFANELGNPYWAEEALRLRQNVEYKLTEDVTINGARCRAIRYVNKRYYIPFGWWANPLPSLASTAWGVFLDSNWNPLHLGGAYASHY